MTWVAWLLPPNLQAQLCTEIIGVKWLVQWMPSCIFTLGWASRNPGPSAAGATLLAEAPSISRVLPWLDLW